MSSKTDNDKLVQQRVQSTFDKIYYGEVVDLKCPYCSLQPLRFSYTFVKPDRYGIWISCTQCRGEAHLRLKQKPPGYNEANSLKEFQERDEKAINKTEEWWKTVSKRNS